MCSCDTLPVILSEAKDLWTLLMSTKMHRSFASLRMTGKMLRATPHFQLRIVGFMPS